MKHPLGEVGVNIWQDLARHVGKTKGSAYLEFLLRKFAAACGVAAEQEVK